MEFNDLKKNMTVLEQILSKTNMTVNIDKNRSETAKGKLIKTYRQSLVKCAIAAIIPLVLIATAYDTMSFPLYLKIYLLVFLLSASIWNLFLVNRTKRIDVSTMLPMQLFTASSKLRLYTLSGEVFFAIALTIFFSLFLPAFWDNKRLSFWSVIVCVIIGVIFTLRLYIPKLLEAFRDLESIE